MKQSRMQLEPLRGEKIIYKDFKKTYLKKMIYKTEKKVNLFENIFKDQHFCSENIFYLIYII